MTYRRRCGYGQFTSRKSWSDASRDIPSFCAGKREMSAFEAKAACAGHAGISPFDPKRTPGDAAFRTCEIDHVSAFIGFIRKEVAEVARLVAQPIPPYPLSAQQGRYTIQSNFRD